jgi:hypothetical protein
MRVKVFPDQIAAATKSGGGFDEIVRSGNPDAWTLVLRSAIDVVTSSRRRHMLRRL